MGRVCRTLVRVNKAGTSRVEISAVVTQARKPVSVGCEILSWSIVFSASKFVSSLGRIRSCCFITRSIVAYVELLSLYRKSELVSCIHTDRN